MKRHAGAATALVQAVVFLDYAAIQTIGRSVSVEELGGECDSGVHCLPGLPRAFFLEQVTFNTVARQLARAAEDRDEGAVSDRFAALVRTCVGCHASYVHGRAEP
jgi:hypothetical protein